MKREKIHLFILVVEIALIAFLHSAKKVESDTGSQLVKQQNTAKTYELSTPASAVKP